MLSNIVVCRLLWRDSNSGLHSEISRWGRNIEYERQATYRVIVEGWYMGVSVFDKLIWRTIDPKSSLFGTAQFSLWPILYYIVTNSINSLLIGSRCVLNGAHTNHFWANLAQTSKLIKKTLMGVYWGGRATYKDIVLCLLVN